MESFSPLDLLFVKKICLANIAIYDMRFMKDLYHLPPFV